LSQIAVKNKIWFHVDAAWGGAVLLSRKYKPLLKGIENADSVVLDGHKFFYLSISHSVVLFKDHASLNQIKHSANYIIREGSVDLGRTSIEGSRRFDSFKFWFAMNVLGRNGYETIINTAIEKTKYFAKLIEKHPDFELTSDYGLGILTYRFFPSEFRHHNYSSNKLNLFFNKINIEIQKKQRAKGRSFVSRTTLESVVADQNVVVLRALPFNPLTNERSLTEILREQSKLGRMILDNQKSIFNALRTS
jgi:glutamate decarboxylase